MWDGAEIQNFGEMERFYRFRVQESVLLDYDKIYQ